MTTIAEQFNNYLTVMNALPELRILSSDLQHAATAGEPYERIANSINILHLNIEELAMRAENLSVDLVNEDIQSVNPSMTK